MVQVKTRGLVKGELTVKSDLAEWQRQGLFAHPGKTYQVAARYAIEPSHILKDTVRSSQLGRSFVNVLLKSILSTNRRRLREVWE